MRQLTTEIVANVAGKGLLAKIASNVTAKGIQGAATNYAKAQAAGTVQKTVGKKAKMAQRPGATAGAVNKQKLPGVGVNPNLQLSHNEPNLEAEVLWELKKSNVLEEILDAAGKEIPASKEEKPKAKTKVPDKLPVRGANRTPVTQKARDKEALKLRQGRLKDTRENRGVKKDFKSKKKAAKQAGKLKREEDFARKGGRTWVGTKKVAKAGGKVAKLGFKAGVGLVGATALGGGHAIGGLGKGAGRAIAGTVKGAGHAIGGTAKGLGDVAKSGADIAKSGADVTKTAIKSGAGLVKGTAKGGKGLAKGVVGGTVGGLTKVGSTFARAAYRGGRYH